MATSNTVLVEQGEGKENNALRYTVKVYLFGLSNGGSVFREEWYGSLLCEAVCQFADVELVIEDRPSQTTIGALKEPSQHRNIIAVVYDGETSNVLEKIRTSFLLSSQNQAIRYLIHNSRFKDTIQDVSTQLPEDINLIEADLPGEIVKVFKLLILQPLVDGMSDEDIERVTISSCQTGSINVLKVFLTTGRLPPLTVWLPQVLQTLQHMSCNDRNVPKLLEIAELAYNLNVTQCRDYLQSDWSLTPKSTLLVLSKVSNPFNMQFEHLYYSHQSLSSLLPLSIADTCYTHISLSHNLLKSLPEELFQLRTLQVLDVSYNYIDKIPSFLRWNCPKLRELNLSYNQLIDVRRGVLRGQTTDTRRHSYASGDNDPHTVPQQMVLQLTSHNMYSCVFSLADIDLSHNPKLTRLPEWVPVLPHLVRLNLLGLPKLRELPKSLVNFKDLSIIRIDSSSMVSPPAVICSQGSQAIITYLKSQQRGSNTYRHMNLLLLGWSESNDKSLLIKKLSSQKSTNSSEAVEVCTYDYRGETLDRSVVKVTYHITSFSNEAMNLSLYQCFLVSRCVYLCVWNQSEGKEGLIKQLPVLRNIYSTLPQSRVILCVLCNDGQSSITTSDILSWQSEVFGVDNPAALYDHDYSNSYGLPCIGQTLIIDVKSKEDIDTLKQYIHYSAGELKVTNSTEKLMEELVPRSYTALQSHVESKVKLRTTIVRYSEFIDSFRSISHQSGDTSDSDKEFVLACQFLHDTGTIFHYRSIPTTNDLFILNLQWLSDTLAKILNLTTTCIITHIALISLMGSIGISSSYYQPFTNIMVHFNLLLPLSIERNSYVVPFLLPDSDLSCPYYDLYRDDLILRKVSFRYLPHSFFSHLISRLLTYIEQLGAQLMISSYPLPPLVQTTPQVSTGIVSAIKRGKFYKLSQGGYIVREKDCENTEDSFVALCKVRAMSVNVPVHAAHRDSMSSKMKALSENFHDKLPSFTASSRESFDWSHESLYSRSFLWRNGLHVEFLDKTRIWVEFGRDEITLVSTGSETGRVKALASLISSVQIICQERYVKLQVSFHSPCPDCLKSGDPPYFDLSQVSLSQSIVCTKCNSQQSLNSLAPDLLLMDYEESLRLDEGKLEFEHNEDNWLGKKVYKGTYVGKPVVIKLFHSSDGNYLDDLRRLRFEFNILHSINHDHVIQVLGALCQPLSIVFPLAPHGSLQEHLELCPNGLDDRLSHITLHQVAKGLQYLHSLNIIHRDIKPGNILVWSLHPSRGVHIKITDCGLSQFADSFGFRLRRGTEDYMAPELYSSSSKNSSYNEKVDIFSFGILLYNVVTGKRFIPQFAKRDKGRDNHFHVPYLSIIAIAIEEQRLQTSGTCAAKDLLVNGTHPAARQGHITTCISTCMQVILESCLSVDPNRRPTADGLAARLMICVGPSTQEKYILDQNWCIEDVVTLPKGGGVIAWEMEGHRRIVLIDERSYSTQLLSLPSAESCRHITITHDKLFAVLSSKKIVSYKFPLLDTCISTKAPLPGLSSCLFTSFDASLIVVGIENGRIALYISQGGGPALLSSPIIAKPFDHPDKRKTQVTCGIVHEERILCGSGRYLVGLSVPHLQQLYFKPLSDNGMYLRGMVSYGSYLWVWFGDYGEIVICDINTGNRLDSIEMRSILRDTVSESHALQVLVSTVKASPDMMWVGTSDGHLFGFHHDTFELLTAVQQHSYINGVVTTSLGVLLVFGQWKCGEYDTIGGFTAWRLHKDNSITGY